LVLVLYGTLGPLDPHGRKWLARPAHWSWMLPSVHSDADDAFTNVAVYIPVGMALRLLLRRRGRAGSADLVPALALSVMLSYGTELAQQLMPARSANLMDCAYNSLGALLGCLAAPLLQRWLRVAHAEAYEANHGGSWTLLAWVASAVTAGLMLVPFRVARTPMEIDVTRHLDLEDVRRYGMFVIVGFCWTAAAVRRWGDSPRVVRAAMPAVLLMAVVFETAQLFITTHACGLLDMFIAALGGVTGCAMATKFAELHIIGDTRRQPLDRHRSHRIIQTIALACILASIVLFGLHRLTAAPATGPVELGVCWVPFQTYFAQPFHHALAGLIESMLLYGALAMLCLVLARWDRQTLALLVVLSLSVLLECTRMLSALGPADVTAPILALSAWFLACRFWSAMVPREPAPPMPAFATVPLRPPST
jgi:glycopeptide antibiotics resistance protein